MSDYLHTTQPEQDFRESILPNNVKFIKDLDSTTAGVGGTKMLNIKFDEDGIFSSFGDVKPRSALILFDHGSIKSVTFTDSKLTGPFDEGLSVVEARVLKSINGFKPLDMDRLKVFREGNGVKKFELVNSMAAFKKDLGNFNTVINL